LYISENILVDFPSSGLIVLLLTWFWFGKY